MQYKILDSINSINLEKSINKKIKEGWEPLGGVSITGDFHGIIVYAQAIVREKPLIPSQM